MDATGTVTSEQSTVREALVEMLLAYTLLQSEASGTDTRRYLELGLLEQSSAVPRVPLGATHC